MAAELDALDLQIIDELRRDGRQANVEIARLLGAGETTIRTRVRRLIKSGVIQVAAAVNLTRLGYDLHVIVGVHCEAGRIDDVMHCLAAVQEVRMISAVSGHWDLLLTASFRSRADLFSFLTERLGAIPGVRKSETLHALLEAKREYYFWETQPFPEVEVRDS